MGGWHTDIHESAEATQTFPSVRFMVFDFGQRGDYIGRNQSHIAMMAVPLPSTYTNANRVL
jgi:hypothetical protein